MKVKQLKAYYLPTGDGVHNFVVAAENMTVACEMLNCSPGYFKRCGGRALEDCPRDREAMTLALGKPGTVFKQPAIPDINGPKPWEEDL